MAEYPQDFKELAPAIAELRQRIPDVWAGYAQTRRAVMVEGALSVKHKELMALAIAIVKKCDGCIAAHARGAARNGASPDEVAETVGVTLLLEGGPATTFGPRAWLVYQQFKAETDAADPAARP
ncbi:MAG: carboxymuconolactone decarboxylase family protein [Candidatus Dormibacteria bacterium]